LNPQATLTKGVRGCSDDESFSLEGGEDDDNMLLDFLREENAAKCAPAIYLSSWHANSGREMANALPGLNNLLTRAPAGCVACTCLL